MLRIFIISVVFQIMLVAQIKTVIDMFNKEVEIPSTVKKIYAPSPYGSLALYAMDSSLLAGWIFEIDSKNYPYLSENMKTLPVIGRVFGTGQRANLEVLLSQHPDLILMWSHNDEISQKEEEQLKLLNSPIIYVKEKNLFDYPNIFKFLGDTLNLEKRGEELASYTQNVFNKVEKTLKKIPNEKRPKVYYAQGVDGLATECNDSIHVELLQIVGDVNIHRCQTSSHKGFEKISMEKVIQYNPDVILIQEKIFFENIKNSELWKDIKAVKNNKVFLIPKKPFNWFDRPPSFMRILGLQWLMANLYPEYYIFNKNEEIKKFYKLFLNVSITDEQISNILNDL
ncbi:ABC transporter substrate-binding protein [Arcobacter sp. L]|uniref:ABC transporter substrate-binding protein n=1 Tax=Arcobacter sp. L TaxID=944547 RepID=UPI000C7AA880|nr:ABC transporter substrate-binding protein [Arcobacter sp. L]